MVRGFVGTTRAKRGTRVCDDWCCIIIPLFQNSAEEVLVWTLPPKQEHGQSFSFRLKYDHAFKSWSLDKIWHFMTFRWGCPNIICYFLQKNDLFSPKKHTSSWDHSWVGPQFLFKTQGGPKWSHSPFDRTLEPRTCLHILCCWHLRRPRWWTVILFVGPCEGIHPTGVWYNGWVRE